MGLYPAPGQVDIMVASEILEAARAMESGFVTPDRTTLVASTHRVYAISEKSDQADGRYDRDSVLNAVEELACERYCSDFSGLAEREDSALNAVLLGLIAATKQLPIPSEVFTDAIRDRGIAVESNLLGYNAGLSWTPEVAKKGAERVRSTGPPEMPNLPEALQHRIAGQFPVETTDVLQAGTARVIDFQDTDYANVYLDRVHKVLSVDSVAKGYALCRETARYLALWMTYEDIIRVADLKSRPERYVRVREEVQARPHEPVLINEFMKPGVDELAAVLPQKIGRSLLDRRDRLKWMSFSIRLGSHTIVGHRMMRLLAGCRRWRRKSLRWQEEQALIERWLDNLCQAALVSYELAVETAHCANLNKGYGDTFKRGRDNFIRIMESLVEPALSGEIDAKVAARVKSACAAALHDDTGAGLDANLQHVTTPPGSAAT
jgi:indolepyruvate ferredoxin oxidoreductase beta subunit